MRSADGTPALLHDDRWFALLAMTRVLAALMAIALLLAHHVTDHDTALAVVTAAWTAVTLGGFGRSARLRHAPGAWTADALAAFALVLASNDWRSPFYVFALTTLVLPATTLSWRPAIGWGVAFAAGYAVVALLTHKVPLSTLESTIRLETLATHLLVPLIITLALAYASVMIERLRRERLRSERLAVQAERQRIAWELHDSAKQRVHAAHLVLTSLEADPADARQEAITLAADELRAATLDMETSIAELRSQLDVRSVDERLRERAQELMRLGAPRIVIAGRLAQLSPRLAANTYRIAAEALTNAVRHAECGTVRVLLSDRPGGGTILVEDDGVGIPDGERRDSHGVSSMQGRAAMIGARLEISARTGGGTRVALALPQPASGDSP